MFLNRRGYAPVLACDACGWVSRLPALQRLSWCCTSRERALRCHHCGWEARMPRACPDCGNVDIAPMGRGTQRVEETLASAGAGARACCASTPTARAARAALRRAFRDVHAGEVDILVGTQMVAKGHDFRRVTLVGVLNPDTALFSHDFRASERLFALLMQVGGRAGRAGLPGEVLVQTRYPRHALYHALGATITSVSPIRRWPSGATRFAAVRAIRRCCARKAAHSRLRSLFCSRPRPNSAGIAAAERVTVYDAVPLTIVKVMTSTARSCC